MTSFSFLPHLPPEIWAQIFGFVRDPGDLARCARVDWNWRAFFEEAQRRTEEELWWGPVTWRIHQAIEFDTRESSWYWKHNPTVEGPDGSTVVRLQDFPLPWNQPRSLDAFFRVCLPIRIMPVCLSLCSNRLTCVPRDLCKLVNLLALNLSNNRLEGVPPPLCRMKRLKSLHLGRNLLESVPPELGDLLDLELLDLSHNRLATVPRELGKLTTLRKLDLSHNRLTTLPRELGKLTTLRKLDLSHNRLTTLSREFAHLGERTICVIPGNRHICVPDILRSRVGYSSHGW